MPEHFKIDLWPVGEPPFMLAISVYEALRDAVAQAKGHGEAVRLTAPATAENVLRALQSGA